MSWIVKALYCAVKRWDNEFCRKVEDFFSDMSNTIASSPKATPKAMAIAPPAPSQAGEREPSSDGEMPQAAANITVTRRRNVRLIFQDYAESQLSAGASPNGLEQSFARMIQVSPSMWSQIKKSRPIGDKIARQIEGLSGKSSGWLDQDRDAGTSEASEGEQQFLARALKAFRATNAQGRKALNAWLLAIEEGRVGVSDLKALAKGLPPTADRSTDPTD